MRVQRAKQPQSLAVFRHFENENGECKDIPYTPAVVWNVNKIIAPARYLTTFRKTSFLKAFVLNNGRPTPWL